MSKILFENKKVALGFAGAIVLGAAVFSGMSGATGDAEQSQLASVEGLKTGPQIEADQNAAKNKKAKEKEEIAFADDEELIDQTSGFEPSPQDEEEAEDEAEEDNDRDDRSDGFDDDPYSFDDEEEDEDPFALEGF